MRLGFSLALGGSSASTPAVIRASFDGTGGTVTITLTPVARASFDGAAGTVEARING